MTDLPPDLLDSIPSRLGVTLDVDDAGRLTGVLSPLPGMCDRGVVPAYALLFLADGMVVGRLDRADATRIAETMSELER